MLNNNKKKQTRRDGPQRKSAAEALYPNQYKNTENPLNPVIQRGEEEHKKKVAYYQNLLGRNLTGAEVLYPDNIKNSRGEAVTPYEEWAARQKQTPQFTKPVQTRQTARNEAPLNSWRQQQANRQGPLYAQANAPATDAAPGQRPQLNEHGYYRPGAEEFAHIDHGPDAALGYRNRNPGNVRRDGNSQWDGMRDVDGQDFIIFENDHYGIRALARNMNTQFQHGRYRTIRGLLNRYAPATDDNDTQAYINHLVQRLGVSADEELDMNDPEVLSELVPVIIRHETGSNPYTDEQIRNAVRDAMDRQ